MQDKRTLFFFFLSFSFLWGWIRCLQPRQRATSAITLKGTLEEYTCSDFIFFNVLFLFLKYLYIYLLIIFILAAPSLSCGTRDLRCSMQDLQLQHADSLLQHVGSNSPTRDRTWAPCTGSMESYPLDHQGSPTFALTLVHFGSRSFMRNSYNIHIYPIHCVFASNYVSFRQLCILNELLYTCGQQGSQQDWL